MTIYATPYRESDKQATEVSAVSGFDSLAQVAKLMPIDTSVRSKRVMLYPAGDNSIAYSDFPFLIDGPDTTR